MCKQSGIFLDSKQMLHSKCRSEQDEKVPSSPRCRRISLERKNPISLIHLIFNWLPFIYFAHNHASQVVVKLHRNDPASVADIASNVNERVQSNGIFTLCEPKHSLWWHILLLHGVHFKQKSMFREFIEEHISRAEGLRTLLTDIHFLAQRSNWNFHLFSQNFATADFFEFWWTRVELQKTYSHLKWTLVGRWNVWCHVRIVYVCVRVFV